MIDEEFIETLNLIEKKFEDIRTLFNKLKQNAFDRIRSNVNVSEKSSKILNENISNISNESINKPIVTDCNEKITQKADTKIVSIRNESIENFVISFAASTRNFFIQNDIDGFEKFVNEFTEAYLECNLSRLRVNKNDLIIGEIYAILFEIDDCYYRVRYLDDDPREIDNIQIMFVDLGEIQSIRANSLLELLPQFKNVPYFALNCFINANWLENNKRLDSLLLNFVDESHLHYDSIVGRLSEPLYGKYPIEIELKNLQGEWINLIEYQFDILNDEIPQFKFDPKSFSMEKLDHKKILQFYDQLDHLTSYSEAVKLNETVCIQSFDVQNFLLSIRKQNELSVENFVTNLSFFYANSIDLKSPNSLRSDNLVVILHDNFFFRGLVLSESEQNNHLVFLFDLGLSVWVRPKDVYTLVEDLFSLKIIPPFTVYCSMNNLIPLKANWSPIAINQFNNLIGTYNSSNIPKLLAEIKSYERGLFNVDVKNGSNDIGSVLLKFRLATKKT
ncbi:hypothetical protein SSS_08058 [Sarcoptes scabiei]|uniref:Tudor domain-containing protein n=1 Tax=Sarcoptes scabiei TaxID=52283 RepID=A0A834RCS8_SARSC|nr:hypothetical protein SSS_08058 [Sarcoptes scabiei]